MLFESISRRLLLICFSSTVVKSLLRFVNVTEITMHIILSILWAPLTWLQPILSWINLGRHTSFRMSTNLLFHQDGVQYTGCNILLRAIVSMSLQHLSSGTQSHIAKVTRRNVSTRTWSVESRMPFRSLFFTKDSGGHSGILTYLLDRLPTVSYMVVSAWSWHLVMTRWMQS